jgi:Ca-activated chloride channel family protein
VTFATPLVLVALLAIPVLIRWYAGEQRRRVRAARSFVAPALTPSVAPRRPRWRRHAPMLLFAIAVAALIIAAARPQRSVAVPIESAGIMLVNDVSDSMRSADVKPSRLVAAQRAAERFLTGVPGAIQVGSLEFAGHPTVLQSPTTDRALTRAAVMQLRPGGGGTATGDAILTALRVLTSLPKQGGKRPPGAIVLLSDGGANAGYSPAASARQARAAHIPIYTIALGTPHGTVPVKQGATTINAPVPVSDLQLATIARLSGGRPFTAGDAAGASAVYAHLAIELGHKNVKREITASFAGGGLALLLLGSVLSLAWFGRLA